MCEKSRISRLFSFILGIFLRIPTKQNNIVENKIEYMGPSLRVASEKQRQQQGEYLFMSITIRQLNILAEKYGFSIEEARQTIGLPSGHRGRPAKAKELPEKTASDWIHPGNWFGSANEDDDKKTGPVEGKKAKPKSAAKTGTSDKAPGRKTGYHLYMSKESVQVKADLEKRLKSGEKLGRNDVRSEIGRRWKNLPVSSRDIWNEKAQAA
jgi:hypothetical protein